MKHLGAAITALMMAGVAGNAWADVKAGVDAWAQGDYARAIREWRLLAEAGDPDAQFNMGQAYKLGRGVPADLNRALDYYKRAADKGHQQAEDNYGLLLFQQNRRAEAMLYLMHSAERGEPRAQYLVGTALFNGDLVAKDWVRAYAMMSRAAEAGLPQAAHTLSLMDQYIPQPQRIEGIALAGQMERAAEQGAGASTGAVPKPALRETPKALRTTDLPPSKSVTEPVAETPPQPKAAVRAIPAPAPAAPPATVSGKWRVQLGAFSEAKRAEVQWKAVSAKVPALSGYQHYAVAGGGVTRLLAGPLASRADADRLCATIKATGADCIVKAM
tara:strand:+ start:4149 stop:5138 length:990 start_codon:yes stop_codon:yes gene_type:complete